MNLELRRKISEEVALKVKAQPKQCYKNAVLGLSYLQGDEILHGNKMYYVEGLACIKSFGIPMEHGWIELSDNSIVDPTWYDHTGEIGYFPIRRFTYKQINTILDQFGATLPISNSFECVVRADYYDAWNKAAEYAGFHLNLPKK